MAKYRVRLITTAELVITVDADNEEGAIEEAFQEAPGLCAQCSGWGQRYGVDLGEWTTPDDFFDDWSEERYGETVTPDSD